MKKMLSDLYVAAGSVDQTKVSIVFFLITLAMFVVAAGAPDAGGTTVR